jgi:hypothetical protein
MVKYGDMDGLYTKTCFVLRVAGCVLFWFLIRIA